MGEETELRWPLLTSARSLFPRSSAETSLWKAGQAQRSRSKEKADFCSYKPTGKGGMSPSLCPELLQPLRRIPRGIPRTKPRCWEVALP